LCLCLEIALGEAKLIESVRVLRYKLGRKRKYPRPHGSGISPPMRCYRPSPYSAGDVIQHVHAGSGCFSLASQMHLDTLPSSKKSTMIGIRKGALDLNIAVSKTMSVMHVKILHDSGCHPSMFISSLLEVQEPRYPVMHFRKEKHKHNCWS
jgi:hypothetical protein